ncbi:MAG: alpha/beta hydrolase-fold protein [Polyangiaceae bacterium]
MNCCRRTVRVHYAVQSGESIVLRTEANWDADVVASRVSEDGRTFEFDLEAERPFLYFKACLRAGDALTWMPGANRLVLLDVPGAADVHPYFRSSPDGTFEPPIVLPSKELGRDVTLRVYLPPGYLEAERRRFPVVYMQDGQNLFFPEEAFLGHEWQVDETIAKLDSMSAVDPMIVVGILSGDRKDDYTKPGYERYAAAVVREVKPLVDAKFRTRDAPLDTAVMGSSLGGVVSFYMAWQYPEVFGYAACMSSTFTFQDDLLQRVLSEPKRNTSFYLDSGWPEDNYEVTLAMEAALLSRGYEQGKDILHLVYPKGRHNERSWSARLHVPLQLWRGAAKAASMRERLAQAPPSALKTS